MEPMVYKAQSDLKKYAKLNNYTAKAFSKYSFMSHLRLKFELSEFEIQQAVRLGKIRIYVL